MNWAQALDTPPFDTYATTCGITFTFGGLRIERETGQVLNVHFRKIPGLYCGGEMVGGLLYLRTLAATHNEPIIGSPRLRAATAMAGS